MNTQKKLRAAVVFGTRPDAVKMVPLVKELKSNPMFETIVCVTAQHREMLDQVLDIFKVTPDHDLNIMQSRQTLEHVTTKAVVGLGEVFEKAEPSVVLVHGDTTTCFAAGLAAFYKKIRIGHVEAGLRTFDKYNPFPEEMNRKLTGVLADYHFCPTISNKLNLLKEGIKEDSIYITGNTVIDALGTTVSKDYVFEEDSLNRICSSDKKIITVEAHRRENLGLPLEDICNAVKQLAFEFKNIQIVYPVHLNPAVRDTVYSILSDIPGVYLIPPVNVSDMHNLISRSYMLLTDSGGLQEEAPSLGKPVVVLRNETERPEAVEAGTVIIAGTKMDNVLSISRKLLTDSSLYEKMSKSINPYGDGKASARIAEALLFEFGFTHEKPVDFKY